MSVILFLICYFLVGLGMFLSVAFVCAEDERLDLPKVWIIFAWPIIYLLGLMEFIDWVGREFRRDDYDQ